MALFASAAYTENLPIIDDLGNSTFMNQPEKSQTFELGASYVSNDVFADGDSLQVKANLFTTNLWDVTSYSGVDTVDSEGVELELTYAMDNGLYVDLNAAYGDYVRDGVLPWSNAPANSARLTVGKRINETWDLSWEQVVAENGNNNRGGLWHPAICAPPTARRMVFWPGPRFASGSKMPLTACISQTLQPSLPQAATSS